MKINKKFYLAFSKDGIVVNLLENNDAEIFLAAGVEVKEFDTLEEGEKFIEEEILK